MVLQDNKIYVREQQLMSSSIKSNNCPKYSRNSDGTNEFRKSKILDELFSNMSERKGFTCNNGIGNISHESYSDGILAYTSSDHSSLSQISKSDVSFSHSDAKFESLSAIYSDEISDKTRLISIVNGDQLFNPADDDLQTLEIYTKKPSSSTIVKAVAKLHKSVRFSDQVGHELTSEYIIIDSALPPLLTRFRFDANEIDDSGIQIYPSYDESIVFARAPISEVIEYNFTPRSHDRVPMSNSDEVSFSPILKNSSDIENEVCYKWRLKFPQPDSNSQEFKHHLESSNVSLASIHAAVAEADVNAVRLYGTVQVRKIAFQKKVKLRITNDRWKTFKDHIAVQCNSELLPLNSSSNCVTFLFDVTISMPERIHATMQNFSQHNPEVQFAVLCMIGETPDIVEYWDNNDGNNYTLVAYMKPKLSIPIQGKKLTKKQVNGHRNKLKSIKEELRGVNYQTHNSDTFPRSEIMFEISTRIHGPIFTCRESFTSYSSFQQYSTENCYY